MLIQSTTVSQAYDYNSLVADKLAQTAPKSKKKEKVQMKIQINHKKTKKGKAATSEKYRSDESDDESSTAKPLQAVNQANFNLHCVTN